MEESFKWEKRDKTHHSLKESCLGEVGLFPDEEKAGDIALVVIGMVRKER
jgi:hypothetical protein